jgi:MFS family permease
MAHRPFDRLAEYAFLAFGVLLFIFSLFVARLAVGETVFRWSAISLFAGWGVLACISAIGKRLRPFAAEQYERIVNALAVQDAAAVSTAIAGIAREKHRDQMIGSATLAAAISSYVLFGWLMGHRGSVWPVVFLGAALLLLNAGMIVSRYRWEHGLYGTSEYEAREIVRFILENADDIDFSDGLGAKNIPLDSEETFLSDLWQPAGVR